MECLMNNNLKMLRIIETIMQVVIVPLIIVDGFSYKAYNYYYNGSTELTSNNLLDAADWADGYLGAIFMLILAIIALVLVWTPACKWTIVPAFFEIVIVLRTILYVLKLHSAGSPDHLGGLAIPYLLLTIAALVVAFLIGTASKKQKEDPPIE